MGYIVEESQPSGKGELDSGRGYHVPVVNEVWTSRDDNSEEETIGYHRLGEEEFSFIGHDEEDASEGDVPVLNESDDEDGTKGEFDEEPWVTSRAD